MTLHAPLSTKPARYVGPDAITEALTTLAAAVEASRDAPSFLADEGDVEAARNAFKAVARAAGVLVAEVAYRLNARPGYAAVCKAYDKAYEATCEACAEAAAIVEFSETWDGDGEGGE